MRNGRAPAGFRPNGRPFGLQSRSRLGTFEPAKSMESGEVLALGNPCETAKPHSRIPAQGVAVWSAAQISFRRLRTAKSMEVSALGNPCETAEPLQHSGPMGGRLVCRADLVWAPLNPLKTWRVESKGIGAGQPMRNSRASAGFRPNGWPFGLQSRSRLGTFEPAQSMEVSALGNPCETAQPQQDSGSMCGRLVCRADLVWAPLNPLKAWRVERYWRWATHAKQQSPTAGFQPKGWPFGLQRRSRLGTFEPDKSMESGKVLALGNPCETAEPLQDSGPMGGRLVCRADLVWAPLNPLKAWRVERYWRWATHAKQQSPTAGFQPKGWPFGLQRRSRLGTVEPAKSMEVSALGNPCETAEPLQDSGPMGGRLVCRADLVWAPLNPLKTWRVERYWRWATHAKRQSPCRIQAQWVAVWSAEPISFGHL